MYKYICVILTTDHDMGHNADYDDRDDDDGGENVNDRHGDRQTHHLHNHMHIDHTVGLFGHYKNLYLCFI